MIKIFNTIIIKENRNCCIYQSLSCTVMFNVQINKKNISIKMNHLTIVENI